MGSANGTHCVEAMGSSLAAHTGVSPDLKRQCCALSLFANLKAGSPALNLIAREFFGSGSGDMQATAGHAHTRLDQHGV